MRRHSWKSTGTHTPDTDLDTAPGAVPDKCEHCQTERVRDRYAKSLYLYRGGNAIAPGYRSLTVSGDRWCAYVAGAIPQCVERG